MTRPVFGNTLRKIANASDPVQLFYNSSMTSQIVQEMRAGGIENETRVLSIVIIFLRRWNYHRRRFSKLHGKMG